MATETLDIRVATDLPDHPKYIKLERRIGEGAMKTLVLLWGWARKYRPTGELPDTGDDIEIAARWRGEAGKLISALLDVRFLTGSEGAYVLHDWEEHQPWASKADERSDRARKGGLGKAAKAKALLDPCSTSATSSHQVETKQVKTACLTPAPLLSSPLQSNPPPPARDATEPAPAGGGDDEDHPPDPAEKRVREVAAILGRPERLPLLYGTWLPDRDGPELLIAVRQAVTGSRSLLGRTAQSLAGELLEAAEGAKSTMRTVSTPRAFVTPMRRRMIELDAELARRPTNPTSPPPGVGAAAEGNPLTPIERLELAHLEGRCAEACYLCGDARERAALREAAPPG